MRSAKHTGLHSPTYMQAQALSQTRTGVRMAYAKRTDANQKALVNLMRQCGATVAVLSAVGKDFPDLVVGYAGINVLAEVKDGNKSPSQQLLSVGQQRFHDTWRGWVVVLRSEADALALLKKMREKGSPC